MNYDYDQLFDKDSDVLQRYELDNFSCQFDFIIKFGKLFDFLPKTIEVKLEAKSQKPSNFIRQAIHKANELYQSDKQKSLKLRLLCYFCLSFEEFWADGEKEIPLPNEEIDFQRELRNFMVEKGIVHEQMDLEIKLWSIAEQVTYFSEEPTYINIQLTDSSVSIVKYWLELSKKHAELNVFSYSWGDYSMSAGEISFLDFFAKLYRYSAQMKNESILVILDEAESNFHPNWQRKFVDEINRYLPIVFPKKSIQIILTSHSPFILSDLPKENVIFLKKGEDGKCQVVDGLNDMKQTFGANIHTLLSDGFFMDGLMGDFAKEKIDKVIRFLNNELKQGEKMTDEEAEKIIQMIGEPIVKRHLYQQFHYRKQNTEMKDLKAEMEKLKMQINLQP